MVPCLYFDGYYAHEVKSDSHRFVLYRCAQCTEIFETRIKYIKTSDHICTCCSNKKKMLDHYNISLAKGLAPNGLPLGQDMDKKRHTAKLWRRQWLSTPIGQAINRLRVSLKRVEKGYTTKNLPYSPYEFAAHIQERINVRNNLCPNCGKSFDKVGYNIDHKVSLATAKSPEEALALFALDNLDVLCPECNQFIKCDECWDY